MTVGVARGRDTPTTSIRGVSRTFLWLQGLIVVLVAIGMVIAVAKLA